MKTTEHTPGPWRVGKNGGTVVAYHSIPEISGSDAVDYYGGHLVDESITPANARLIAAAPELLESCQRLLDAYNGTSIPEVDQAMLFASEVIAKATGTTP